MFQHAIQQVHFAVVRNGYDRRQVDSDVADQERRASEARTRLDETEASLTEVTHRVRALEARIASLRDRPRSGRSRSARPVDELADRLLETVSEAGRELPAQILSEAERDRAKIERMASDVQQVARFRAARVVGSARRDREQADQLVEEARRQVDEYLDEGRSRAEAHAQAVWHRARARLHEPMLEVEETRLQGRALRRELRRLRELRDEYWGRVTGHPDGLAEEDTQFA